MTNNKRFMKKEKIKCPICKGKGELELPRKHERDWGIVKRRMARTLLKTGFSHRQVQKFIGWGSVRSVSLAKSEFKK